MIILDGLLTSLIVASHNFQTTNSLTGRGSDSCEKVVVDSNTYVGVVVCSLLQDTLF